jgi:hypothetical protein
MALSRIAYPLTLTFRILALGQEIVGTDASGEPVCFVKQKAFRLKEDVLIFRDQGQTERLYRIRADRILDIGARYDITDASGRSRVRSNRRACALCGAPRIGSSPRTVSRSA